MTELLSPADTSDTSDIMPGACPYGSVAWKVTSWSGMSATMAAFRDAIQYHNMRGRKGSEGVQSACSSSFVPIYPTRRGPRLASRTTGKPLSSFPDSTSFWSLSRRLFTVLPSSLWITSTSRSVCGNQIYWGSGEGAVKMRENIRRRSCGGLPRCSRVWGRGTVTAPR